MHIIDSHAHLGESRLTENFYTETMLLESQDKSGVDISIVLPIPKDPSGAEASHDRIHRLCQDKHGRFFGVLDLDPSIDDETYWKEFERCIKELGFVGVKLHTYYHPCNPLASFTNKIYEAAKHFHVPIIVHTGMVVPFGLPTLQIQRAKEYPDVTIILAHMGANFYTAEAIIAAQLCDNIFLETSWTGPGRVKEAVRKLGAERVMMGSDQLINLPWELTKIRTIGLSDSQMEDVLWHTAAKVFQLKVV